MFSFLMNLFKGKKGQRMFNVSDLISQLLSVGDVNQASGIVKDVKAVIDLFESKHKLTAVEAIVNANPADAVSQQIKAILG